MDIVKQMTLVFYVFMKTKKEMFCLKFNQIKT